MITSVVRLDNVPVRERFDFWWDTVARSVVSVDASSERAADFWAEMRVIDLGPVQMSRVRCAGFEAHRTMSRIRSSDPEAYQLALVISGRSGIRQERRETLLAPSDLMLYDTSRPFLAWSSSDPHGEDRGPNASASDGVIVQMPHDALPFPAARIRRLLAARLPGRHGVGALLGELLRGLVSQSDDLSVADAGRLSSIVLDLIITTLANALEADATASLADPNRVLLLRIRAFIEQRLESADLSPATIAAAHHISLRHLYRLFQQEGQAVSTWIRQRRLERCRAALADSRLDILPINMIAARWGFTNDSHFNRIFRSAFGVTPATYRRQVRAQHRHPAPPA
ncbi:helix-turn-helix domain-containing protein [Nonomuraea jiangxiensis]|uniref:AraC-type DNA-binding protein n=1 Tax=Nonomuraea jiangxiensis TaxID=633440 RepID=A0A1G9IV92_9ACTN|nr:helix-turn-helix domain-containing protein [Nonomuraea jiangxiensis]SDL29080.1 AraC-type DNA-binding protein [Nonomuraea jiangxiensis]